jgi:hypothetical protein
MPKPKVKKPSNSMTTGNTVIWPVFKDPRDLDKEPRSFLQNLVGEVNFCLGFRIQKCNLPPTLQISQETYFLHQEIVTMQRKLKVSIRRDYEVQRGKILLERKRVIDKSG